VVSDDEITVLANKLEDNKIEIIKLAACADKNRDILLS